MSHEENDHERMSKEQLRAALQSLPRMNAPEELEHRLLSTIATRSRFTPAVLVKGLACAGIAALVVAFGWELVTFDKPIDWRTKALAPATKVAEATAAPPAPVARVAPSPVAATPDAVPPVAGTPTSDSPVASETPRAAPANGQASNPLDPRAPAPKETRVAAQRMYHDSEPTRAAAPVEVRDSLPAVPKLPITTPAVAPPVQPLQDSTRTGDGESSTFNRPAGTSVPTPRDSGLTGGR